MAVRAKRPDANSPGQERGDKHHCQKEQQRFGQRGNVKETVIRIHRAAEQGENETDKAHDHPKPRRARKEKRIDPGIPAQNQQRMVPFHQQRNGEDYQNKHHQTETGGIQRLGQKIADQHRQRQTQTHHQV